MSAVQSLWILCAACLFSSMSVGVKYASATVGTMELVFYRSLIGCLLVGAVALCCGKSLRTRHLSAHWWRGINGFVSLLLFFYALPLLDLSSALALLQTSPLFLALFAAVLMRERPPSPLLFALAASFVGMLLVLRPGFSDAPIGAGLAAAAAGFFAGCAYHNVRRLGVFNEGGIRTVFYFTSLSTVISGAVLLFLNAWTLPSADGIVWIFVVGITATLGQVALTRGLHNGETPVSAALMYSSVVFSGVLDYLLWGATPALVSWLGIILIVGAGVFSVSFTIRRQKSGDRKVLSS